MRGPLVRRSGRVDGLAVTESIVLALLVASDTSPGLRAGLPAALASLAEGDAAPLLHLTQVIRSGGPDDIDEARLLATLCTETRLPWAPESAIATRQAALDAFLAERDGGVGALPRRRRSSKTRSRNCARPGRRRPRPEPVALLGPDVPVLILSGRDDLRTPLEDARRTRGAVPERASCSPCRASVTRCCAPTPPAAPAPGSIAFLRGRTVAPCAQRNPLAAAPYAPATVGALPPTRLSGVRGRTLSALTVTLTGIAFDAAAHGGETFRLPGLRGGYVRGTRRTLRLHNVEWIRGVFISGRLDSRGRGTVSINGPASGWPVTYGRRGASGTLGGRSFTL